MVKQKGINWGGVEPMFFDSQLDPQSRRQFNKIKRQIAGDATYQLMKQQAMDSIAMDSALSPNLYSNQLGQFSNLFDNYFPGFAFLAQVSQNGVAYSICKTISQEMNRKGFEFKCVGDDTDQKRILELKQACIDYKVSEALEWACWLVTAMGGCKIAPKLKGDEDEQDSELYIDDIKIGKGDLEYFKVIDPNWYVAIQYNTINPRDEWFYKPQAYTVLGHITHASRLFKMGYQQAPDILKPTYLFNDIGILQQSLPYISRFEEQVAAVTQIVKRYNVSVLKTNMEAIIDDSTISAGMNGAANMKNRVNIFNAGRNNLGTFVIDKESEDFAQISMQLAGLKELLDQAGEYMSIVSKIPVTKLLGISPGGMNATGEADMRNFYDMIRSMQEIVIRPALTEMIHVMMLSLWGEIDDTIVFEFCKLEETNPVEDSQIRLNDSQTAANYINAGVLSPAEVRAKIANEQGSNYNEIDIDDYDLSEEMAEKVTALPKAKTDNPDIDPSAETNVEQIQGNGKTNNKA
jgi:phage-related protein (TIGR01555 family)